MDILKECFFDQEKKWSKFKIKIKNLGENLKKKPTN